MSACQGHPRASRREAATAFLTALLLAVVLGSPARAEPLDPEVGRMLERALADAENFRKQLPTLEYDAKMRVQEWDARGRLRGTAKAVAIMRPGDPKPMTFISREIEGKVRLPEESSSSKDDDDENKTTLQEFSAKHQMPERFDFQVVGTDSIAGQPARRVTFKPKPDPPKKRNTADRFLGVVEGTAWVSEADNKLVKFDMKLQQPFRLLWIIAVLRELSINYELVERGDIIGKAKLKVLFSLRTPVYSIRQLHDVEMSNFRPRKSVAAVADQL
ncbi:MAG TPA: hypothetical protein VK993_02515 [Chthoniobacterales bacterium]|nr:hypothetical protein [Chthoniobacterales bacterium]